jgi:uncharacterized membrane protein
LVSVTLTQTIKANPERVISFISDFEKAPQYSNYWKSVKLVKRDGNTATYETVAEAEGRKMNSTTKITALPSQRLETETIDGDGKGTRMSFTLSTIPEGTQVVLKGEIVLPGFAKLLGGVVKGKIESGMSEELLIMKKALEKS